MKEAPSSASSLVERNVLAPKISVIIPVFNALPYLSECLDTVLGQTLEDIELICVDDGSMDGSYELLEERSRSDERMKVLQQNENAGAARNLGLANASGEYVLFLDADDFFSEEMCEHVFARAVEKDADIVLFDGREYDHRLGEVREGTTFLRPLHLPTKDVFNARDIPGHIFQITNPAPWSKLFRREFLIDNDLRFQSLPNSNDVFLVLSAMATAERITTLDEDLVRYRINTHASTQDGKSRNPLCFLEAFSALESKLVDLGLYESLKDSFLTAVLRSARYNLNTVANRDARLRILQAIESGEFLKTRLIRDEGDYPSKASRTRGLYIKAAMRQRDLEETVAEGAQIESVYEQINEHETRPVLSIVLAGSGGLEKAQTVIDESAATGLSYFSRAELVVVSPESLVDESHEALSRHFARTSVLGTEGADLAAALNAGFGACSGEYAVFITGEDHIKVQALWEVLPLIEASHPDFIWCGTSRTFKNAPSIQDVSAAISGKEAMRGLLRSGDFVARLENCVFNRDFAISAMESDPYNDRKMPFRPGTLHSEIPFVFLLFSSAGRVHFLERRLVCTREEVAEAASGASSWAEEGTFADCLGYALASDGCMRILDLERASWDSMDMDAALRFIDSVSTEGISVYRHMPVYERGGHVAIDALDERIFKLYVSIPAQLLKKKEELRSAQQKVGRGQAKNAGDRRHENASGAPAPRNRKSARKSFAKRLRRRLSR